MGANLVHLLQESQPIHRLPATSVPERQKSKVATNDRPRHEMGTRKATVALRLMEIRKGAVGASLIEPLGHAFQNLGANGFGRDGRGEKFPVRFRVEVAAVEGQAVALADGVVPVRLDFVDMVGDEAGTVGAASVMARFQGFLVVMVFKGACRWRERCSLEVEAEQGVGVEVVEGCPRPIPVVCEFGMRAVARDCKLCPLGDVGF